MRTRLGLAPLLLLAAALGAASASAQQATERYIPIGRSPGLSGVVTLMGRIDSVDLEYRRLSLALPEGRREVALDAATTIWLDRTRLGLSNTRGALHDCRPPREVEIKLVDDGRTAEWIKVRMESASGP